MTDGRGREGAGGRRVGARVGWLALESLHVWWILDCFPLLPPPVISGNIPPGFDLHFQYTPSWNKLMVYHFMVAVVQLPQAPTPSCILGFLVMLQLPWHARRLFVGHDRSCHALRQHDDALIIHVRRQEHCPLAGQDKHVCPYSGIFPLPDPYCACQPSSLISCSGSFLKH